MNNSTYNATFFEEGIARHLKIRHAKTVERASVKQIFDALARTIMEIIQEKRFDTFSRQSQNDVKEVYYFSAEFLIGRSLFNNLNSLGVTSAVTEALQKCLAINKIYDKYSIEDIEEAEPDAALGNGGLGRLAACFLDSLASLDYPGHGYGILYKYGMFEQAIENGEQKELADSWLACGNPWLVERQDLRVHVFFSGEPVVRFAENGKMYYEFKNSEDIIATPFDLPIVGYKSNTVNRLRLWQASSSSGFNLSEFNNMAYIEAHHKNLEAENITCVLYPNDFGAEGKRLRLRQQYFFTSASLQDILRQFIAKEGTNFQKLPELVVIQLNDTHPVVAIPELMRLLLDDYHLDWEDAEAIVSRVFAYTNHTILAEALEKWSIDMFRQLLPRIYQIIDEINRRFLTMLREKGMDETTVTKMSIIADGFIHMARLAIVVSFSVNGVAKLHTEILKHKELKEWYALFPNKFNNKTNGVTQRRWLLASNPLLSKFITERIGDGWVKDLSQLSVLERSAKDEASLKELAEIKKENKIRLATYLEKTQGIFLDPASIYDVQIKRLHEYKRQLLNTLHIMTLYNHILDDSNYTPHPRTFIFGAKAASGYRMAKNIIRLITTVAERINNDRRTRGLLKVVFVENYRVSVAQLIFPASEVSEQISTAGKEASGTGNMKFMLNGALTLGTMDGANIEIVEEVGRENAFIFGLEAEDVEKLNQPGAYNVSQYLAELPHLQHAITQLVDGSYRTQSGDVFNEIYQSLMHGIEGRRADPYYVIADFASYQEIHEKVLAEYEDWKAWTQKSLLNIARSGKFSSDRTIQNYVDDIWHIKKV